MIRKILPTTLILLTALVLSTACYSGEDDYLYDEPFESAGETFTSDLPPISDQSSPTCLVTMTGMLDYDDDGYEYNDSSYEGIDLEYDEEIALVTYQVSGDEIFSPEFARNIPDDLISFQEDTARHQEIWQFVVDIIPPEERAMLGEFIIFSDGYYNVLGAVDDADTASLWTLEVDIIDAQNLAGLSTTLIHEFGHMLTLNEEQLGEGSASCATYLSEDGCSYEDSYINAFYEAFWTELYDEWSTYDEEDVEEFYENYADQFVTDYAPTNPEEDIAESWLYFVFSPRPDGDTIAEQKILFFYDYPELVNIRQYIINGLCPYIVQ